jgi:hypothetical protein
LPLAYPKIALPDVEETIAFRTVDTILRGDPTLQRVTKCFNSFRGDSTDVMGPTPATCPYLQIAPQAIASRWEAESMHNMPLGVTISAAVNGSNVDQIMNYWGFVRRALWPSDPERVVSIETLAAQAGTTRPAMTMQGYGSKLLPDGGRILVAVGTLNLLLLINTPYIPES